MSNSTSHPASGEATPTSASEANLKKPSVDLQAIYAPVKNELEKVENILRTELSSDTPWVDHLLEHSWLLGGKRMRPAFVLLSAGHFGNVEQPALQMAAALEMVHTATLVHDDILDEAETRRHEPTANSKWGNKVGVLLGDYLFTHSFHVASLSQSIDAVQLLAASSNRVCEGEMRQNNWRGNFDLSEADYLQMISDKTAELTACASEVGAVLAGANAGLVQGFRDYGLSIGIAFQIIDDLLDLSGEVSTVGKTLGTDLLNQKPTLPVIHCLASLETNEKRSFLEMLKAGQADPSSVIPILESTGSIEYSRDLAANFARRSINFANSLDENACSMSLRSIADFVLARTR